MTTLFLIYFFAAVAFLLVLGIVCVKKTQVFTGLRSVLPSPDNRENSKNDVTDLDKMQDCIKEKSDLSPFHIRRLEKGVNIPNVRLGKGEKNGYKTKQKINRRGTRGK